MLFVLITPIIDTSTNGRHSMIIKFSKDFDGYKLSGSADIEPAEPATTLEQGWPQIATVIDLYINGASFNAYDIVSPSIIQTIEAELSIEEY